MRRPAAVSVPMRADLRRAAAKLAPRPDAHSTTFQKFSTFHYPSHVEAMPALSKTLLRSESASGVNFFAQEIVTAVIFA